MTEEANATALRLFLEGNPPAALDALADGDAKARRAMKAGKLGTALERLRDIVGEDPAPTPRRSLSPF